MMLFVELIAQHFCMKAALKKKRGKSSLTKKGRNCGKRSSEYDQKVTNGVLISSIATVNVLNDLNDTLN